mmetsp:Transcript_9056/g.27211  ORF Transcript_9056/g.27211 Transcript_9056/m.27211 type:complete len:239 (+) Transcript_9056:117-833(+)|eukprot:CAMPEP_0198733388 /NCGR_PEP_ID=MMETSP1475-20131203/45445_1 /TAXON_ID= ORGANISM="Unidentified sp., Strain CCMP1999" /NCGR_SAMPLE_ID=MMETSP1475 /ASSEMBLY_ACC=CAM_ASM_001111 /LENGTH=238 /DNA_ID=CAMNT_0044496679 /DNA_START=98 /DNA_END=814 /DNA_ORIENTATION=-
MDYTEEQEQEIEALSAIFGDDLKEVSEGSGVAEGERKYQLPIVDDVTGVAARMDFVLGPKYPEEAPRVVLVGQNGISASKRAQLSSVLDSAANESVGMPMIFNLHSLAMEWLGEHIDADAANNDSVFGENAVTREKDTLFETRDEEEEAKAAHREKMKFHGTPVTVESFNIWKEKFNVEMAAQRALAEVDINSKQVKCTGRELFEQNKAVVTEDSESFWEMEADAYDYDDDDVSGEED